MIRDTTDRATSTFSTLCNPSPLLKGGVLAPTIQILPFFAFSLVVSRLSGLLKVD
jgi:hypothetical protein